MCTDTDIWYFIVFIDDNRSYTPYEDILKMSAVGDSVGGENCFDIEKVSELFEGSLIDDDDVRMEDYLEAYEEIMK